MTSSYDRLFKAQQACDELHAQVERLNAAIAQAVAADVEVDVDLLRNEVHDLSGHRVLHSELKVQCRLNLEQSVHIRPTAPSEPPEAALLMVEPFSPDPKDY